MPDPEVDRDIPAAGDPAAPPEQASRRRRRATLVELAVMCAVIIGGLFAVQQFLVKPFQIPSESMEPTLNIGDRILVNRIADRWSDPQVGQMIVFYPPAGADAEGGPYCADADQGIGHPQMCSAAVGEPARKDPYVKRVVAVGGDTIMLRAGRLIRNGQPAHEPYVRPCPADAGDLCDFPRPITVPAGQLFVLGDNRAHSNDSRFWGPINRDQVVGRAILKLWPPTQLGGL